MHTVDDVLSLVRQKVAPVRPVQTPLSQAPGHLLAEPIRMSEDSPPFDRALVDGCAVLCDANSGKLNAGTTLKLLGHLDAGAIPTPDLALRPGGGVMINTGAPLPPNADAVVMVEDLEHLILEGLPHVRLTRPISRNFGLQRRGADAKAGASVLTPGTLLTPAALAVAATAGFSHLPLRIPRVALLTTGDELVPPETPTLATGQIRNSNHPMLSGLIASTRASLQDLGTAKDHRDTLHALLQNALHTADLLIVSGGMSMGTRDLIPPLLKELGVSLHVEKVRMKPGKPFLFGTLQTPSHTAHVAGLPGNPVSAFVTFQRLVRPILAQLAGNTADLPLPTAPLAEPLPPNGDREFYQPCTLSPDGRAHPLPWRGSADVFTLAKAHALLLRPANAPALPAGAPVPYLSLAY